MLSQDQIKNLANKFQTTEVNILREYFQHLFLSYFYQQPQSSNIFFKGGTALRFLYNSPRFSEDLDFSTTYADIKEIEEAVLNVLNEIQRENITVELGESKQTSGGYLGTIELEKSIPILLQISLREGDKKGQVITVPNDFIPSYTIISLDQAQLAGEKLQALFDRKKPRDFYDLYFMLRANLIAQENRVVLKQALEILDKTDINFENELKIFLPKSQWLIIRDFKSALEREINRFI